MSAGWPYLYEIPGLHNCVPMLFADTIARYRRLRGDDVLFVSGADEHGSRVEFVAQGHGRTPRELVDEKVAATRPLLNRLDLSLDLFARTSDPSHERFVMSFFERLLRCDVLERRAFRVPFCPECEKYLPDRFTEGRCPRCGAPAFGNQCSDKRHCAAILEPFELEDARCAVCGGPFEERQRQHLFLPLSPLREQLHRHIHESYAGAPAVAERALAVLRSTNGILLTRDTDWGAPLPASADLAGRTVYSWVDSLLGKISALVALGAEDAVFRRAGADKLFFIGADGVGFYAVLFPALLLATRDGYALDGFQIVTNDVLIYEGGVCSKSTRTGIWLPEALALLPSDYWRFVIFEAEAQVAQTDAAPGSADLDFRWEKFARDANLRLGALGALYEGLAGTNPVPDTGAPEIEAVIRALDTLKPGAAFGLLLGALCAAGTVSRPGLAAGALPLLGCFLPDAAKRAQEMLAGTSSAPLFPELPLGGATLRGAYEGAAAARRTRLTLEAELADIRADALCVCPTQIEEK